LNPKPITNFVSQFGVQIALNLDLMVEKNGRFYLVNPVLKPLVRQDFFYAGVYLGKVKEGKFFPSFNLLGMLAKKGAYRVVLDRKAAWLFICGRDVLGKSIVRVQGPGKKHTNTLVVNEFGECLGFGRIVGNLSGEGGADQIVVRNVSDVGDFLRRER
jgi:ribosome biogenesis protein Nip4